MDYEKKYKETLAKAREIHCNESEKRFDMEWLFPELKESEDEQSKKWILEYLYDGLRKSDEQFKDQFKAAISWIEKQGSAQKSFDYENVNIQQKDFVHKSMGGLINGVNSCNEPNYSSCSPSVTYQVSYELSDGIVHYTSYSLSLAPCSYSKTCS